MTFEQLIAEYRALCDKAAGIEVTEDQLDELTEIGALAQYIDLRRVRREAAKEK